ncbi:MAG TPA: sigma-70 family RNA polymerase sigma factor [Phycisphaerae bacterium]|nr:sigma-70 family RNA polymerase sigma factor [Phycisphaerae bacterium]
MDDAALADVIRGAQRGEPAAFDRLVDGFGSRLAGFLYRLTGSRQESEDLVQEVFLRLVRTIGVYEHDGRFEPWLFRIAANLARDRARRAKRGPGFVSTSKDAGSGNGAHAGGPPRGSFGCAGVDAGLILNEELDTLNAALQRLPDQEREVILLRHFSEMSFKAIAELTGTPLGTALARAHRGLGHLRELMCAEPERTSVDVGKAVPGRKVGMK